MAIRRLPHVVAVDPALRYANFQLGPAVGMVTLKYGTRKVENTTLGGDSTDLGQVSNINVTEGRLWTEDENTRRANVVVLGHDAAEQLFRDESPLGKEIEAEADVPSTQPPRQELILVPAGCATLGLPRGQGFGWDNEFDGHPGSVPAFAIDRYKVSNGDYLRFMDAGGLPNLWTAAGWQWKTEHNITHPAFWTRDGADWRYRGMFNEIALPLAWPVYVSHAEATAYARWVESRLPTEAEWHRAAYGTPEGAERPFPWGDEQPGMKHGGTSISPAGIPLP